MSVLSTQFPVTTDSVAVAAVRQADSARSGHVVVEADIFVDTEEDTITWL
jgi:hypothetical protein